MARGRTSAQTKRHQRDIELATLAQEGNRQEQSDALRAIYDQYHRLMFDQAHKASGGGVEVTEAEVYEVIHKCVCIKGWDSERAMLSTYLGWYMRYYVSHFLQREKSHRERVVARIGSNEDKYEEEDGAVEVPQEQTPFHIPAAALEMRESAGRTQELMEDLPPRCRETLTIFIGGGSPDKDDLAVAKAALYSLMQLRASGII
jgi:DNA-directed RNA polymerase specialized sigma24 family protein